VLDRWVLARLAKTNIAVTEFLDHYDTVRASRELVDVINEVSTWFVRRSRDRIKAGDADSQAALNTLGYVLTTISTMLAPWMPYVSEHIYRDVTGKESVHLASWPTLTLSADQAQLLDNMQAVRDAVELGLALRKDAGIKIRQPLGTVHYQLKSKGVISEELTQVLAEELNVKKIVASDAITPTEMLLVKENSTATIGLDISITPELAAEGTARELERQIQDLRKTSRLQIGEMVDVYYTTQSPELSKVMDTLVDRKKVFAQNITTSLEVEADFEVQAEIDGQAIWLGIVRI
jgi:isoleucyl-tRNA synthetase